MAKRTKALKHSHGLNTVPAEIRYLLLFREFQITKYTNILCGIKSAELKGKVRDSMNAYTKVLLDLVQARGEP